MRKTLYYKKIGKCADKLDSGCITEIYRQIDALRILSQRLYEDDFYNQKERNIMPITPAYATKKDLLTLKKEIIAMMKDKKEQEPKKKAKKKMKKAK